MTVLASSEAWGEEGFPTTFTPSVLLDECVLRCVASLPADVDVGCDSWVPVAASMREGERVERESTVQQVAGWKSWLGNRCRNDVRNDVVGTDHFIVINYDVVLVKCFNHNIDTTKPMKWTGFGSRFQSFPPNFMTWAQWMNSIWPSYRSGGLVLGSRSDKKIVYLQQSAYFAILQILILDAKK